MSDNDRRIANGQTGSVRLLREEMLRLLFSVDELALSPDETSFKEHMNIIIPFNC